MSIDLSRLLPNATNKKKEDAFDNMMYTILVDWGWSYSDLINTPIPVIIRLLRKHNNINKKNGIRK